MLIAERVDNQSLNIGNISYNDLNDLLGQHCSSSLAQHSIYRLKTILCECWWLSASIIIRQIYRKLFLQCFELYDRSTLQINTSTTFNLSFKTVLYEWWLRSAPIIIRQIYRKLFLHWFECYTRSTLQINTSTPFDLSFKNNIIRMMIAERADHHSSNI